jgi:hypothetical protein
MFCTMVWSHDCPAVLARESHYETVALNIGQRQNKMRLKKIPCTYLLGGGALLPRMGLLNRA